MNDLESFFSDSDSASDCYLTRSPMVIASEKSEIAAVEYELHLAQAARALELLEAEQAADAEGAESLAQLELSVLMPCLNEADTLATCIEKAQRFMREQNIAGEIIVSDNGSTDGSQEIARSLGARVVSVEATGYGSALMGGILAARGKYIIMGDADDSYDFQEIPKFMEKLRAGHDLVQGCRLPAGCGTVMPGAMPLSHRWLGNPMFSCMLRGMFGAPVNDVYCRMRGFKRELLEKLNLRCAGMEFATEMIIQSTLFGKDIAEVPITLHPGGRKAHASHLRTFRDGWRTLQFFMMYSPRWLYLAPGLSLLLFGLLGYALAMPGITVLGAALDAHTLLISSLAILMGYQTLWFAIFTKTFAASEGLMPADPNLGSLTQCMNLERGLIAGTTGIVVGVTMVGIAVMKWYQVGFGALDYSQTMRWVIPGMTLSALGFQTMVSSFFVSILKMGRKS